VEALLPNDYDRGRGKIRIHRDTKTGNDECRPVVAPLAELLSDGWGQINPRRAEYEIRKKIKGTNLTWRGWYAFRRGLATNLYQCGMPDSLQFRRSCASALHPLGTRAHQD
jgi:hypothetical protein